MWYCWKHKPKESVTIDTVWTELKLASIAFYPKIVVNNDENINSNDSNLTNDINNCNNNCEGVFPLTYLRGIDGMFIAIARTSKRASDLYEKARDLLEQLEK